MTAKDTIDMIAEINEDVKIKIHDYIISTMNEIGYEFLWQEDGNPRYKVFVKGFGENHGKQEFIIHSAPNKHQIWDRLFFRDYLREFPIVAEEYKSLKKKLAIQHQFDRVGYSIAKTDFVTSVTQKAKEHYGS